MSVCVGPNTCMNYANIRIFCEPLPRFLHYQFWETSLSGTFKLNPFINRSLKPSALFTFKQTGVKIPAHSSRRWQIHKSGSHSKAASTTEEERKVINVEFYFSSLHYLGKSISLFLKSDLMIIHTSIVLTRRYTAHNCRNHQHEQ